MAGENQVKPQEDLNHVLQARRDKLAELQASGSDPFQITKYDQTHHSTEIKRTLCRTGRQGSIHCRSYDV